MCRKMYTMTWNFNLINTILIISETKKGVLTVEKLWYIFKVNKSNLSKKVKKII